MTATNSILNPPSQSLSSPSAKSAEEPSVWQKIVLSVSSYFTCYEFFCPCAYPSIEPHEIHLLRPLTPPEKPVATPFANKSVVQVSSKPTDSKATSQEESKPVYQRFDDSLEELRECFRQFASLTLSFLHDKQMDVQLEKLQKAAHSLPSLVKSFVLLLTQMGDKASKPLFQKFIKQKAKVIDGQLKKTFSALIKEDHTLLKESLYSYLQKKISLFTLPSEVIPADYLNVIIPWIFHHEEQNQLIPTQFPKNFSISTEIVETLVLEAQTFLHRYRVQDLADLRQHLEQKITQELTEAQLPHGQQLKAHYIDPILHWFLYTDFSTPLMDQITIINSSDAILDRIFEKLISLLIERKIDQHVHKLEKILQNRFKKLVGTTLQINGVRIIDFFSGRIAELISAMPFSQTFDALFHNVVDPQIRGIVAAEAMRYTHKNLLNKAKKSETLVATEMRLKLQDHLKNVAQYGSEPSFLDAIFLEEFSHHPACSPEVQQIIQQENALARQKTDPLHARQANENAIYNAFADNLLKLLLSPGKKINEAGELIDYDPFTELWNILYFPKEFNELIVQMEDLVGEFVSPETASLLNRIRQPSMEVMRNMFRAALQDALKKYIVKSMQSVFELFTNPARMNELFAESLLPFVNESLLGLIVAQEVGLNIAALAPLFYNLIKEGAVKRETNVERLQRFLIKSTKEKLKQFEGKKFFILLAEKEDQPTYGDLNEEQWLTITRRVIDATEHALVRAFSDRSPPISFSLPQTINLLHKLYASKGQNDPIFGKIVMNLIFKLGEWPLESFVGYFIKDLLSGSITEGLSEIRASHVYLVSSISQSFKEHFLNKKGIEELFSSPPKKHSNSQKIFAHQINITARLAHDMIMQGVEPKGVIPKLAVQKMLTNQATEVNRLISKIYYKLLGNPIINLNMLVKFFDEILRGLNSADKSLRSNLNLRAQQLSS